MANVVPPNKQSTSTEWMTPQPLFDLLDREFHFTLDPCATHENAKCKNFFTKEQDGLKQSWARHRVFCNPPYGKEAPKWVAKGRHEAERNGALVVFLIVPRTDTEWWHEHCSQASEIRLMKGRVAFIDPSGKRNSPQDPNCLVVFKPNSYEPASSSGTGSATLRRFAARQHEEQRTQGGS